MLAERVGSSYVGRERVGSENHSISKASYDYRSSGRLGGKSYGVHYMEKGVMEWYYIRKEVWGGNIGGGSYVVAL